MLSTRHLLLPLAYVPLKSSCTSLFGPHRRGGFALPEWKFRKVNHWVMHTASCHKCSVCKRSSTRVAELLPDVAEISLHRGILNGFRTFCSSKGLSLQKCVPCNKKDMSPMTEGTANGLKPKVPEWELLNDGGVMKLCRKWKVKNFLQGLEFFKIVGDLAEAEGHHPDLHLVGWNNVTIEIWTHACGGLTENDFILAAKIDKLPLESYLRRK